MKPERVSIELFANLIPPSLVHESGKVFYSGRAAFSKPSPLYMLGVNPGGNPADYLIETVGRHTHLVLNELPYNWSAYRDEEWEGAPPGTYGMAPRVLHLLNRLGVNPGSVPASNLLFVRSRREEHIQDRPSVLADLCWPFHAKVIEVLRPKVVLCFGRTAGKYVSGKLGARHLVETFVEQNNRRWESNAFKADDGVHVVVATHPSIANWTKPITDPSVLVLHALGRGA